ncbi:DUF6461 domain-containing protein [Streptosporangium subroseum]|uniref:DUF6461 domain-containing protein n=1 Tax=Streptosporangium subroseum TaxID=106412 RepID=UPI003442A405
MSAATADDYAWFDERDDALNVIGFCITFVHGLTPEETFRRLGITGKPWTDSEGFDPNTVTAGTLDGGTVLVEVSGFAGILDGVAERLSADTRTAAVYLSVNADQRFVHAADGQVVTGFETDGPDDRHGADPDRLLSHMLDLGMPVDDADPDDDWGDPILTAFALAERVTGVRLTPAALDSPSLVGSTAHLY